MSDDFSDRQLRIASWWITHRDQYARMGRRALIGVVALVWIVSLVLWSVFAWREWQYQTFITGVNPDPINFTAFRERTRPQELLFDQSQGLAVGTALVDYVLPVENPNDSWAASVRYQFADGRAPVVGVVLPRSKTLLLDLGVPRGATLRDNPILDVGWHRVRDPGALFARQAELHIHSLADGDATPPVFTPGGSRESPYPRVSFRVTNNGPETYAQPAFLISVRDGSTIVAVHRIVTESVRSGETRDFDATWPDDLAVSAFAIAEVDPDVNFLDSTSYTR